MATYYYDLSPADGADLSRWTPIAFVLVPDAGFLPYVRAELWTDPYDILTVYDGAAFAQLFAEHSTVEEVLPGQYQFSVLPVGGWVEDQASLTLGAISELEAITQQMAAEPDLDPPALSDEGRLLGRDILYQQGTYPLIAGDYKTTEGEPHLLLSVQRLFMVAQYEYQLNPDYGIGLSAELREPGGSARDDELRARAVDQLLRDRRIVDVPKLELERPVEQPEILRVKATIQHIGQRNPQAFTFEVAE